MTDRRASSEKPRRLMAKANLFGASQLHLRNPYVIAMWSALFPGAGYMMLSKYIRAYVLFIWEIIINLMGNVNLALFYTLLGRFDAAKDAVDTRVSLLYIPTFIFVVWDSYRCTVELNKQYLLASRENAPVTPYYISPFGITYLDKRPPYVAPMWCAMNPGIGQIMLQRILNALFIMFWWVVVVYFSNILPAIHLTVFGDFAGARDGLDPQWLMDIPSLFFFCVYTTYTCAIESNKLFDREQAQFLAKNYQSPEFELPAEESGKAGEDMYIVSVFRQSLQVELALSALHEEGVSGKDIMAVPVAKELPETKLFDTMYSSTGDSVLDLPMILAAFAALFGCIYGFVLAWGPVVWGVIGAALGFGLGLVVKILVLKRKKTKSRENQVVVVVSCKAAKSEQVRRVLGDNGALGVSLAGPQA